MALAPGQSLEKHKCCVSSIAMLTWPFFQTDEPRPMDHASLASRLSPNCRIEFLCCHHWMRTYLIGRLRGWGRPVAINTLFMSEPFWNHFEAVKTLQKFCQGRSFSSCQLVDLLVIFTSVLLHSSCSWFPGRHPSSFFFVSNVFTSPGITVNFLSKGNDWE